MIVTTSSPTRSAAILATLGAARRIAAHVAGSISKFSRVAKRIARSTRRWSSSKRSRGIADRADDAGAQIAHPAHQVDDPLAGRVEVHPADREVAPARVLLDRAEAHRRGTAAVDVGRVGAKSGDLERVAVDDHDDHAEARADRDRVVEQALHDLGTRVGRDVVVLGRDAEHAVAHASAGEVGDEAALAQAVDYRQCLIFLLDTHGRPMRFNLASRAARGHGCAAGFQTNDDGGRAA